MSTGARRSQLLALRWRDIDFDRGAVAFTRSVVVGPDGVELGPTKTHRTNRVDIDEVTLAVLVEHRIARGEIARGTPGGNAFVFSSATDGSKPWLTNRVTKQFIAARRQAGLDHLRLHDLRHFMRPTC